LYRKGQGWDGVTFFPGVCSGAPLPPEPSPVKCEVSLNNNIIDFGKISANKFVKAGAGSAPEGVSPQTRPINIKCSGDAESNSMRLMIKANEISGNYILSSDKNIGFEIKNESGDIVTPNNSSGAIKISTSSDGLADVQINAVPISISGAKPAVGEFSSTVSLVVEND